MPIRGARIYQWRRECWAFLDHRTTTLLNWEAKLKSNSKNTTHFSFKPNRLASPACRTPSFDFLSFLGRLPACPGPTGFPIRFILVRHLSHRTDPLHSEPASCPACQTQQLYHIPTALSVCGPPRAPCTSCTSCLEQPVCIDLPPCTACRRPSVCAHAPFMPFLSVKAADLRSQHSLSVFHLTTSPWLLLHVIHLSTIDTTRMQSLCTIFLVPMPSLLSVTLLSRPPLPFGLFVSYPPFYPMPQHTHVLHLHTAYRT